MAMSHEEMARECEEELVVRRRVLLSSYPKGSLWLEIAQCESWAKIKAGGNKEA